MNGYRPLIRRTVLVVVLVLLVVLRNWQLTTAEDPANPIGLNKKVLVILIDWQGKGQQDATPPRYDAKGYENLLQSAVNEYYQRATYNQTTFDFFVPVNPNTADGWWIPSYDYSQYYGIWATDPVNAPERNKGPIVQDAMNLVSSVVDVSQFPRVLLIGNTKKRGAQYDTFTYNGTDYKGLTSGEAENDQSLVTLISHELGHTLGLDDFYCGPFDPCAAGNYGQWDLMDHDPSFNHFSGWSKVNRGWIAGDKVKTIGIGPLDPARSETVTITALNRPSVAEDAPNVVRLPVYEGPPFYGYYLECRLTGNGDTNVRRLPGSGDANFQEEGILVTLVDESGSETLCKSPATVVKPLEFNDFCDAPLADGGLNTPGETYVNSVRGLVIQNLGIEDDTCVAQISYEPSIEPPDPAITRSVETYQYSQYSLLESPDIWVDSQQNGWGSFPADQALDGDGAPDGPGDLPWQQQTNRIYFRVRNSGSSLAGNVTVDVSVIQPLVIYGSCGNSIPPADLIGSVTIPTLAPGQTTIDYIEWIPTSAQMGKIQVQIRPVPGELTSANNYAEESVRIPFSGVVTQEGPSTTISTALPVVNLCDLPIQINTVPAGGFPPDLPDPTLGWSLDISPQIQLFGPVETGEIVVSATSPSGLEPGALLEIPLAIYTSPLAELMPETEVTPLLFNTVSLEASTVSPSSITCALDAAEIAPGEMLGIAGQLDPPLAGQVVALETITPTGVSVIRNLVSDQNGAFSTEIAFQDEGSWQVKNYWAGSPTYAAAESSTCSFTLAAAQNQPPDADAGGPYSGKEGDSISLNQASAGDPEGDPFSIQWAVNSNLCTFSDSTTLQPTITCVDDGTYTATLTADDGEHDPVSSASTVIVSNVAPAVAAVNVPLVPVDLNEQAMYAVHVSFSDPAGSQDEPYTCTFDLDYDGANFSADSVVSEVSGMSCSTTLTYSEPGLYRVEVWVTDDDGDTGMGTAETLIAVYDPAAGFVTGSGWIGVSAGSCRLDAFCADAEGRANFGFVARYNRGAGRPNGKTEFNFRAGSLNFQSNSYDWLVVNQNGRDAQFKGQGTINGAGDYKFMLWAEDNDPDTLRMKIWVETAGGAEQIVFDNGTKQALGGGNIVVHKGK
jgi:M6 family metalloprotease-like protein